MNIWHDQNLEGHSNNLDLDSTDSYTSFWKFIFYHSDFLYFNEIILWDMKYAYRYTQFYFLKILKLTSEN